MNPEPTPTPAPIACPVEDACLIDYRDGAWWIAPGTDAPTGPWVAVTAVAPTVLPDTATAPPGQPDLTGAIVAAVLIATAAVDRVRSAVRR